MTDVTDAPVQVDVDTAADEVVLPAGGLVYRSLLLLDSGRDAVAVAEDQFRSWLRSKNYDGDVPESGFTWISERVSVASVRHDGRDGTVAARWRMTEGRDGSPPWIVILTAHQPPHAPGLVQVDIHAPRSRSGRLPWSSVPRLVSGILTVAPAVDGAAVMAARPTPVRGTGDDVDRVWDAVMDPHRTRPVYVANSGDLPFQPFLNLVAKVTKETVGLGSVYVLDEAAAAEFNARIGEPHAIPPGTVRTFRLNPMPGSRIDARWHKVLSASRLVDTPDKRLAKTLGWVAREMAEEAPLPPQAARADRVLSRLENDLAVNLDPEQVAALARLVDAEAERFLVEAAEQAAAETATVHVEVTESEVTEVEVTEDTVEVVREVDVTTVTDTAAGSVTPGGFLAAARTWVHRTLRAIGVTVPDDDDPLPTAANLLAAGKTAQEKAEQARARLETLQGDLDEVRADALEAHERLASEQYEHAVTLEEFERLANEVLVLRRRLTEAGRAEDTYVPAEALEEHGPDTYEALLDRMPTMGGPAVDPGTSPLRHVVFTGNPDVVRDMETLDPWGVSAVKAWQALLALDDYVQARIDGKFTAGGFYDYLQFTPSGCRGWPLTQYAPDESDDVHNRDKFRKHRVLPVPETVDADGCVFMGAHFRLARKESISPRVHFWDDSHGSGKMYVGYIGRHLPNSRS